MDTQLDFEIPPEKGLEKTGEIVAEVSPGPINTDGLTDLQGRQFDPQIHKVHPDGTPIIGSKNNLLLKPEAKKRGVMQWAKEKISKAWTGEESAEKDEPEALEIPLSDHELPPENTDEPPEKETIRPGANVLQDQGRRSLTDSAENSADLYFIGGSMLFGVEFLNQRDRFHPDVARAIYDYERRTGKSIDLPPGVALACGLGRIGWEIINREPACKERFDSGAAVVRQNAVKFIGRKLPKFRREDKEGGAE